MTDTGATVNFVDSQESVLTNVTDSLTYIQITDTVMDMNSEVTKHHLTDDTVDNVYDLHANSIDGNMWITPPQWPALHQLTVGIGHISSLTIVDGGTGYSTAPTVTIAAPTTGVTATATSTISGGIVNSLTITNIGSGYTTSPTVTIAAPSSGTTASGAANLSSTRPSKTWTLLETDQSNTTTTTTIVGQMKTLKKIDVGIGSVKLFFRIEGTQTVSVV